MADNRAADEAKIRSIDEEWVKSVAGKDAQKSASYYADGGALMAPGVPLATGKDAVQKTMVGMMGTPGALAVAIPVNTRIQPMSTRIHDILVLDLDVSKCCVLFVPKPPGSLIVFLLMLLPN